MEEKICCICGKKFKERGNNPYPVKDKGVCCDKCNQDIVLTARIINLYSKDKK